MWGLVKQELKQFFSKGVIIFLILVCLSSSKISYPLSGAGYGGIHEGVGHVMGRRNFPLEKERSSPYVGKVDEELLAEAASWYQQSEELPEYFEYSDVYRSFSHILAADHSWELEAKEPLLSVPPTSLEYHYAPGWSQLLGDLGWWIVPLVLCILMILGTASSFAGEYEANMNEIMSSMKYGRKKQAIAKWIASWLGQTIILLLVFLAFMLGIVFLIGLGDGNASIQFSIRAYPYLISVRSGVLLTVLSLWLGMLLTGSITMLVSKFSRNKLWTVIISGLILVVPPLLAVSDTAVVKTISKFFPLGHIPIDNISIANWIWIALVTVITTVISFCLTLNHRGKD